MCKRHISATVIIIITAVVSIIIMVAIIINNNIGINNILFGRSSGEYEYFSSTDKQYILANKTARSLYCRRLIEIIDAVATANVYARCFILT